MFFQSLGAWPEGKDLKQSRDLHVTSSCCSVSSLLWEMSERKDLLDHGNTNVNMKIPCSHYDDYAIKMGYFMIVISAQIIALIIVQRGHSPQCSCQMPLLIRKWQLMPEGTVVRVRQKLQAGEPEEESQARVPGANTEPGGGKRIEQGLMSAKRAGRHQELEQGEGGTGRRRAGCLKLLKVLRLEAGGTGSSSGCQYVIQGRQMQPVI